MAESRQLSEQYLSDQYDPLLYAAQYCALTQELLERPERDQIRQFRQLELKSICNIFKKGGVAGDRLLEIGCGACLDVVALPALHFHQVYLSDFSPKCRRLIEDWLNQKEGAVDWSYTFRYLAELHGGGDRVTADEIEQNLRQKVKAVLTCDVLKDEVLGSADIQPFSCIVTSLCLDGVCDTLDSYERALARLVPLLETRGHLVLFMCLNNRYHLVGDYQVKALPLKMDQVKNAFQKAGFTILSCEEMDMNVASFTEDIADIFGAVTIHAIKEE